MLFVCLLIVWHPKPGGSRAIHSMYQLRLALGVVIVAPPSGPRYFRLPLFPAANQNQPIDIRDKNLGGFQSRKSQAALDREYIYAIYI